MPRPKGFKHTTETKLKISSALLGKKKNLRPNQKFGRPKTTVTKFCECCGKEFFGAKWYMKDRKYCSYVCSNRQPRNRSHTAWNKGLTKEFDSRVKKYIENRKLNIETCETCERKFNGKSALKLHILYKHNGGKPSLGFKGKHHTENAKKRCGVKPDDFSQRMIESYKRNPELIELRRKQNPWSFHKTEGEIELHKDRLRKARLNQIFPERNTNVEKFIRQVLEEIGADFEEQVSIYPYQVDFFVDERLIIAGYGCYWHACKCCGFDYGTSSEKIICYDQKRIKYEKQKMVKKNEAI